MVRRWPVEAFPWRPESTFRGLVSPARDLQRLPARVRRRIVEQEMASEQLAGWVQLSLAFCLGLLWIVSPRPADASPSMASPLPWIIAFYAAFTALRLHFAYRRPLPGPLILASIAVDVALLLALIWLFHGQYAEPPAFSLKVPTFVYLFVLVALRALRFEARYVLAAGVAAAGGWIVLTGLVVLASPPGTVTRNFVAYVHGNAVLLGAEIDKVLAILATTGVLALAVSRSRDLLATAVAEHTAGQEVRRFLSRGVADAVTGGDRRSEAGEAVQRQAAILFLDVRGFTALAMRLPPAEVVRILTSLHAVVVPIIRRHGGVVDKFLGDGIMATFGVVEASPTAAADAIGALDAILVETAGWTAEPARPVPHAGPRPVLNGAVAAGDVVAALLGDSERLEFTVIGDAVNTAAKLEKLNKSLGTRALVTAAAYDLAIAQGHVPEGRGMRRTTVTVPGATDAIAVVAID